MAIIYSTIGLLLGSWIIWKLNFKSDVLEKEQR